MPDQNEILLFEVKLDAKKTQAEAEELRAVIAKLRAEKAALDKDYKTGAITAEQYGKSMQGVETNLSRATTQLKGHTKALELDDKQQKSAQGSIDQMRAKLIAMNSVYDSLSEAERENAKTGVMLQQNIETLTDKLKDLESQTGRDQRNVGNYADALGKTSEATSFLAEKVGTLKENLTTAKEGLEAAKLGLTGVKGAIAATGIGLLLLALNALYSYLTKSRDGMAFVAKAGRILGSVVGVITDKFVAVGKAVFDAFRDIPAAFAAVGNAIKENITNRLNAVSVIMDAITNFDFTKGLNGLIQLLTGITNFTGRASAGMNDLNGEIQTAIDTNEAMYQANKKLEDAERSLNIERARSTAIINQQKIIASDNTKEIEVRLAAAKKAFDIENSITQKQLALQKQRIALINQENAANSGEIDDNRLAEAQIKLADIQAESSAAQKKAQAEINALTIEGERQQLQAAITATDARIAEIQRYGGAAEQVNTELEELNIKRLKDQFKLDTVAFTEGNKNRIELETKLQSDISKVQYDSTVAYSDLLDRVSEDQINIRLAQAKRGSTELLEVEKESIDLQASIEDVSATRTIKTQEELNAKRKLIEAKRVQDIKEVNEQIRKIELDNQTELYEARLAGTKAGTKEELQARIDLLRQNLAKELESDTINNEHRANLVAQANRQMADLQKAFVSQQFSNVIDSVSQTSNALSKVFDAQSASQSNALDKAQQAQLKSAGLNASQRQKIEENFAKKKEDLDKKAAERRKIIATIENIIAIARGETEAFKLPPPFNLIQAALVAANGLAQQAVISSQQFALGGAAFVTDQRGNIVNGPGTATSDSIPARLSNGESVVNAKSTALFYDVLSAINQAGGGRAFPGTKTGRTFSPDLKLAAGGVAFSAQAAGFAPVDYQAISRVIADTVSGAIANLPPQYIAVTDIRAVDNGLKAVEARASK